MIRRGRLVATIAAGIAAFAPSSADALPCADVAAYPGDGAERTAIAEWMAYGASLTATPRELPVIGALVESGLANLRSPELDTAGYFQARMGIWNRGEYAGYPDNPPLQLQWFLDQAAIVRRAQIAAGAPDPALDERRWGDWIADVLVPAENLRFRYQLRLAEARTLIGAPCTPPPAGQPPLPAASSPSSVDRTAPALQISGARRQRALRAGAIVLDAGCAAEPCAIFAAATIALPRGAPDITLRPRALPAGAGGPLRFVLAAADTRKRIRAALRSRRSVTASVRVTAIDAAGNRSTLTRTVHVTG